MYLVDNSFLHCPISQISRSFLKYTFITFTFIATSFAKSMGFKEENLTTPYSKNITENWKQRNCQPNFREVDQFSPSLSPSLPPSLIYLGMDSTCYVRITLRYPLISHVTTFLNFSILTFLPFTFFLFQCLD